MFHFCSGLAVASKEIYLDESSVHYAVVKNGFALPELPGSAFVEVPAMMRGDAAYPLVAEPLPAFAKALCVAVKEYERMLIRAAKNRDKKSMLNAMMVHPLMNCYRVAKPLLEECLALDGEYVPGVQESSRGRRKKCPLLFHLRVMTKTFHAFYNLNQYVFVLTI